jgi:hypothetical protein
MDSSAEGKLRVKKYITSEFNHMLSGILSIVEILSKNEFQYDRARKKVLRLGNNGLRDIMLELDSYNIQGTGRDKVEQYELDEGDGNGR